jgi:hypothetical protein
MTLRQKQLQTMSTDKRLTTVYNQLKTSYLSHTREIQQQYGSDALSNEEK